MLSWVLDSVGYFYVKKNMVEKRENFFTCVSSNHLASQEGILLFQTNLVDLLLKLCAIDSYSSNKYTFV